MVFHRFLHTWSVIVELESKDCLRPHNCCITFGTSGVFPFKESMKKYTGVLSIIWPVHQRKSNLPIIITNFELNAIPSSQFYQCMENLIVNIDVRVNLVFLQWCYTFCSHVAVLAILIIT